MPALCQGPHPTCPWAVGLFIIAVPPDQAGHQPVPGPHDGTAGQCAEWEGLSHSEDQVTPTQAAHLSRCPGLFSHPPLCSNGQGCFQSEVSLRRVAQDAGCLFLLIPESSRGSGTSSVRRGKGYGMGQILSWIQNHFSRCCLCRHTAKSDLL